MIVGLLFSFIAEFYTEKQSRNQLINDANTIYDIILNEEKGNDITSSNVRQEIHKKVFNEAGRIDSNFALISKELKVLYPKNEGAERFERQILPQISNKLNTKKNKFVSIQIDNIDYQLVILPPRNNVSAGLKGYIVLYSPVGPIHKLITTMILVLLISLILTGIIATIAGIVLARKIARPIVKLRNKADSLSKLNYDGTVEINTGDELEELGETINKMAAELKAHDEAQKMFFQNASHEMKTPLMSIQGYAEGMKDKVFDNDDEALDVIIEESKRLKGIVDELIYLSKVEFSEDCYTFTDEKINEVIDKSIEKLKGVFVKNNIEVNFLPDKDLFIHIDRNKIIQALINILGNSVRYAENEIKIITSVLENSVEIKIVDDGAGFVNDEADHVFDRFYKGKKGSSGLGLAITKSIIEKHHGAVSAVSAQEGGAMFIITLPVS